MNIFFTQVTHTGQVTNKTLAPIFLSTFHGPGIVTDGDTAMKIKQNKAKQIKLCSHRTHILVVCRPTANKQKYKYMSHDDKCYKEKLS